MSGSMSTSPAASQPGRVDNIDSLLDLSEYDSNPFTSPSLSPEVSSKTTFARPVKTEVNTPSLLSSGPQLSGPSHQYDLYKQQTGIVPGALATTFAVNQNNALIHGYGSYGLGGYLDMSATDDLFDFNAAPSQASLTSPDMDNMDFDSPSSDPNFFFGEATVNPSVIGGQEPSNLPSPPVMSTPTSNVGRLWPGMHQQAAMAKAQQQQQQQRQKAQQQQSKQTPRQKSPSDPIVEQKITQLLNSMRAKSSVEEDSEGSPMMNLPRTRKDEEDMDEDERLLASEEGKKLSSKERRQLRNKVSARAFRSRRKEYITQLEAEIANKVTENGELRAQNRALADENKRLSDLTKMLLSSSAFSSFLDQLSQNPEQLAQVQPQPQQQAQQQQEQPRQLPKDVNPYAAQQQTQHQQIGLAMIPEQTMDYSMLSLGPMDGFNYQPHVYTALLDEQPAIDTALLSGKTSNFVGSQEEFDSEEEKVDMPVISERPTPAKENAPVLATPVLDEEFESNPAFALYHESTAVEPSAEPAAVEFDVEGLSDIDIFGGIAPEKAFARFELVDATEDEANATIAMARIQRISANLESVMTRLEALTLEY
ncbi:putative bzip transcription factor protein [Rhypophila decipiens]|uniref:Bzip transcription factor protein n=1 Tax=Rhypophila decipiens TaxID=261697 RepID=A0AAN6Y6M8_9PEZI|nr:putative bzip transcription factor protein [Rhypophila decipiens]